MALLRGREVATLQFGGGYDVTDVLVLPTSFTKGARAISANGNKEKHSVTSSLVQFKK